MHLKMGDFIFGMGKEFALSVMEISEKLSPKEGALLFKVGDPASHFYVLLSGRVKLTLGKGGSAVYHAKDPGEVIGWSSLVGRGEFSASAVCSESTELLRFERKSFLAILKKNPANEARLYRRLAQMLGNRLLELYPAIT